MTPRQNKVLQALLTCPTKKEAAALAGVDAKTVTRYLADPEFLKAYKVAFAALVNDATKQMQQALNPAVAALTDIVQDEEEPSSVRISAAKSLLEYTLRYTEFNDVLTELNGET